MKNSRITTLLGIRYPVIQASMVWLNSAELAAAVSNAGGLGVLGPNAGQHEVTHDGEEAAERMREQIRKTRALTGKPFAINYLLPIRGLELSTKYAEPLFRILQEENVRLVITSGDSTEEGDRQIKRFKEEGYVIIHRDLSPTVESAIHAESLGVDALIVTGHEAGGHLSEHRISTLAHVPQIVAAVSIPVIAAGGIIDGRGVKAALGMGAEGVYMGTRFITVTESPASERAKALLLNTKSEDLVELETPVGTMTTIPTGHNIPAEMTDLTKIGQRYVGGIKRGMLDGDLENGFITVSEAVGGITAIRTSKEVIDEIAAIAFS